MATVASSTVPTSKHTKTVVAPRVRNALHSLSSFTSTRAALVLARGAWREEREVEDNMELVGEDKDGGELDREDESKGSGGMI
jgi:hypothetical protein